MIWTVLEDNPWPDKYIPVFVGARRDVKEMVKNLGGFKNFSRESDAMSHAFHLGNKYQVGALRVFYADGPSKKIKL